MFTENKQTYVTHFVGEHKRLHRCLASIRTSLQDPAATLEVIAAQLSAMRDELARHFQEEEKGGCIEEAVCRVPRLAQEAERLDREHDLLLSELGRLIRRCRQNGKLTREKFFEEFEDFLLILRRHEAAENKLVQTGFNVEIEALDQTSR